MLPQLLEVTPGGSRPGLQAGHAGELAFYEIVAQAGTDGLDMQDDTLKAIARDLVDVIRNNSTIDWQRKEQVQARMRSAIKRLLRRYDYPPARHAAVVELAMQQAELLARAA